jgi:hypothetical protein
MNVERVISVLVELSVPPRIDLFTAPCAVIRTGPVPSEEDVVIGPIRTHGSF